MAIPLRALMPALADKTYFNYGGQGPLPQPSLEAMVACWQRIQELGPFSGAVWPHIETTSQQLRSALSRWLGVSTGRLAFTENVTSGCVLPLWGLPWQPGDRLLLSDCEHPGVVAACRELAQRQHLVIDALAVADLRGSVEQAAVAVQDRLAAALQPRTRLVVLSHLLWNTGQLMPIAAVASQLSDHRNQPWLLVDGAQSLGSIPVADAASASDIYACTGHKWCCGPEGLGVVALSPRLLEQARPTLIGWRSLGHESDAAAGFHADARRFEVATSCIPLMAGLACSLQLLEAEGSSEQRLGLIRRLSGRLWEGLRTIPQIRTLLEVPPPAGLVSFTVGANPEGVVKSLGKQRIWLRTLEAPPCLRACTHLTTTPSELDQLLEALRRLVGPQDSAVSQMLR
jgi:L-cysteine/cystine lyase